MTGHFALVPELSEESLRYCEDGELDRLEGVSHWVHLERPERVTASLLDHLDA